MSQRVFGVAALAHAGFQLVVTLKLYPALAAVAAADWHEEHDAHSRRIVPAVALLYGTLLVTGPAVLRRPRSRSLVVALGAEAIAVLTTALVAAPLHRRLGTEPVSADLVRLLRADRVRAAAALLGGLAAARWLGRGAAG